MNKYKAVITTISDSTHCVNYFYIYLEADNEHEVFKKITSNEWFHYTEKGKIAGKDYEGHYFIQVKHISDIYIRKIKEGSNNVH